MCYCRFTRKTIEVLSHVAPLNIELRAPHAGDVGQIASHLPAEDGHVSRGTRKLIAETYRLCYKNMRCSGNCANLYNFVLLSVLYDHGANPLQDFARDMHVPSFHPRPPSTVLALFDRCMISFCPRVRSKIRAICSSDSKLQFEGCCYIPWHIVVAWAPGPTPISFVIQRLPSRVNQTHLIPPVGGVPEITSGCPDVNHTDGLSDILMRVDAMTLITRDESPL